MSISGVVSFKRFVLIQSPTSDFLQIDWSRRFFSTSMTGVRKLREMCLGCCKFEDLSENHVFVMLILNQSGGVGWQFSKRMNSRGRNMMK